MPSKLCIVEIKGGFGNQLFQYNFANYLKSFGHNVKINNSFYSDLKNNPNLTLRKEVFSSEIFNFKNITAFELFLIKFLKKINESKKINKYIPFLKEKYYKYYKDNDFVSSEIKQPIVHFDGYWQDMKYLDLDNQYLKNCLAKVPQIKSSLDRLPPKDSYMLIVRRGDYVKMKQDLSLNFYKECFKYIFKTSINPTINIFTDDVEWVTNQKIFKNVNKVFKPEDNPEKVIYLFSQMLLHENFFVCNSTFSYFAALIGSSSNSKIFIADPWFRNRKSKNLALENWIKIKNS